MKLTFFDEINEYNDDLIMLHDFDTHEAKFLHNYIIKLIQCEIKEINFSDIDFVSIENCNLILKNGLSDIGITKKPDSLDQYVCELTIESYQTMCELIQIYFNEDAVDSGGHVWLYDLNTPIEFLFSPGGTW